jgi:hypothetical protein
MNGGKTADSRAFGAARPATGRQTPNAARCSCSTELPLGASCSVRAIASYPKTGQPQNGT